jgi:hypothetical protein
MEPYFLAERNKRGPIVPMTAEPLSGATWGDWHSPRPGRLWRAVGVALVLSFVFAGTAAATQQGAAAMEKWKLMDKCARQAQTAFPDNNAEAIRKRDAKLKECLNAGNLPPREPFAAPPR